MDRTQLTTALKDFCRSIGFDVIGIAHAEPLESESHHLHEWLQRGYHGTMHYMERNTEKRFDPRSILTTAKSIVVAALCYDTPHRHTPMPGEGKISRYAWGDDYHTVMLDMLHHVTGWLSEHVNSCQSKAYVDTGPVMEKQWARRAGIGWQGKNTNVISRTMGSFFFLGVVITSADLVPDAPIGDYCGTCTACLDACPTGALVAPYVLDATRCISYWTIETKPEEDFPPDIRSNIDGWLFGCDVCQDVCPWNRFRKHTHLEAFQPRNGETSIVLERVLAMTQEEFHQRFRNSPVKRAKLAGLQRNARMLLACEECQQ